MAESLHSVGLTKREEYLAFRAWLRNCLGVGHSKIEKPAGKLKFFGMDLDEFWLDKCDKLGLVTIVESEVGVYQITPTIMAIELAGFKVTES